MSNVSAACAVLRMTRGAPGNFKLMRSVSVFYEIFLMVALYMIDVLDSRPHCLYTFHGYSAGISNMFPIIGHAGGPGGVAPFALLLLKILARPVRTDAPARTNNHWLNDKGEIEESLSIGVGIGARTRR